MINLIIDILKADANIVAITTTSRIYPVSRLEGGVIPAIVVQLTGTDPADTHDTTSTMDDHTVQVTVIEDKPKDANALAVLVRAALDGYAGNSIAEIRFVNQATDVFEAVDLFTQTMVYSVKLHRDNVTIPTALADLGILNLDDISDVNVPAPTDGQALVYDAATSQWVAGDAASALADLTDVALDEPLDREALVYDEATTSWINGGPAKVDFPVFNNSGSQISKGKVVRFAGGAQGDRPTVALFSASSTSQLTTLVGVAMEDIPTGQPGHVRSYGTIYGVNTGAYPVGTVLYCSTTAGELTVNGPAAPNHRIAIAVVTKQNANSGRIFVRTYTPGYDFNDISDFQNSKRDPGMVLTWNGTAAGFAVPTGGYTPPGSPPPGGYTPAVFYRSSTGGFEIDEDLTWVAGTNTLTTINLTGSGVVKGTNTYGARFATEAATNRALANATGVTVERYFTCTAEGNGESFNIQSNTPSAGNKIVRKIWYKNEAFEATDVNTWTLVHTFADNATYASTATQWAATLEAQTYGKPPFTLALSWEDIPAFTGLLDDYPGAAAAYSVRLLDKDYAGSCIRVRRASDNTEQDIGFDANGDLDTAALTSFCTGTNGFVRTWYDQSGSGRHVGQATTSLQPSIVSSGSVLLLNGLPAIDWPSNSANKVLTSTISTSTAITTLAIFSAVRRSGGYIKLYNLGVDDGLSGYAFTPIVGTSFNDWTDTNTGFIGKGFNTGEAPRILSTGTPIPSSATTQNMIFATLSSATSRMFRNKAEVSYGVQSTGNCSALTNVTLYLGNNEASVQQFIGRMQEVVIWSSNKFADRTTAETDAGAYYGIA